MPRIGVTKADRERDEDALDEFYRGFKRSAWGNFWRQYENKTLTVFPRRGEFVWCIADGDDLRYSDDAYESEDEAVESLWFKVGDR